MTRTPFNYILISGVTHIISFSGFNNLINVSGGAAPLTYAGITEAQLKHAVEIVCYKLLIKFKFGSHELDDMKQEAYILAMEVLNSGKYDRARPLTTFLYVHIHNRLYNFKRRHYARLTPPCSRCPLKAWSSASGTPIPTGGYCLAYRDLNECQLYGGWERRNNAKKSLAHNAEGGSPPLTPPSMDIDNVDYLNWIEKQLPPEHLIVWRAYRAGKRVNKEALAIVIVWIQENVVLTY